MFTNRSLWTSFEIYHLFESLIDRLWLLNAVWLISSFSKWNFFWCFSFKCCLQIDHFEPILESVFTCFGFVWICYDFWLIFINVSISKTKFRSMLFFLNCVYKSFTLDHVLEFSTFLRCWLISNDLWMIFTDLLIFKTKFIFMLFFSPLFTNQSLWTIFEMFPICFRFWLIF